MTDTEMHFYPNHFFREKKYGLLISSPNLQILFTFSQNTVFLFCPLHFSSIHSNWGKKDAWWLVESVGIKSKLSYIPLIIFTDCPMLLFTDYYIS